MNDDLEPLALVEELTTEMSMPSLSVNVDFNDLLQSLGEAETFEIIGKLKDLLQS
jgi:hypothetical protein